MIEVFGGDSSNVIKVLIALEELGFAYQRRELHIAKGQQFEPWYLAISPNNKIPAIVDTAPQDGGDPLPLFESGAILIYLAEKAGALLPTAARARSRVLAWVMWQVSGQGPMAGQAGHFRNFAPEPIAYAIHRYSDEIARLYRVLNTHLETREFIADEYSVADIACWPWVLFRDHHGIEFKYYPHVERWFEAIRRRPAVERAIPGFEAPPPPVLDEEARRILFNNRN